MPFDRADESSERRDARHFRRNLSLVGAAHVFVLCILFVLGKWQPRVTATQVLWLDGGALAGAGELSPAPPAGAPAENEAVREPEPQAEEEEPTDPPAPLPAASPSREPEPRPSELVVPETTPRPATPKPETPRPATPRPATPKPKPATPKPSTPKPTTPRAKPATSPKTTPKKSSPTPKPSSPKPAADSSPVKTKASPPVQHALTPAATKENGAKSDGSSAGSAADKKGATEKEPNGGAVGSGNGHGTGSGKSAGRGTGAGSNEFAWYYEMLDDRFTNRWQQPLSIVRSTQDFVTTLKIRINKDGTIASREIANSSGNPLMDESVLEAARKVVAVDPLPAGLGSDSFEVNINFKLDQGQ